MLSYGLNNIRIRIMADGWFYLLIFIAIVVVYTIAKVLRYMRISEQQWQQVDKSKLRRWDDDEEE